MTYANPDALVETELLAEHVADEDIRIIEVDEDTTAYEKGHIEGAVSWNWFVDLHDPLKRDFVDQAGLTRLLQNAGVDQDTTVILYSGNNNWFAAYAYWLLKYLGFDNAKLLNGGRQKWELESRELTSEPATVSKTDFQLGGPVRTELRAFRDDVLSKVGKARFVDVRSPEEFRGEKIAPDHLPQEAAQVPGHIPGASNVTWSRAANEDGTFKSADELRALYEAEGVRSGEEIIAYCRIGERSSHTWFVLHYLLGYDKVRNYDGSWTEWGNRVRAPIERS